MGIQQNILVVGAGITGCSISRLLADAGHRITLIDKRPHLGGICYDYLENEVRVHRYGPHIFHTSKKKVIEFITRFSDFIPYKHKVKALLEDGRYVTIPVNKETVSLVGAENIIDTFIRPYSEKMWGKKLEDLDMGMILKRFPIRTDDNEFYFSDDVFQGLPKDGYVRLFENMIDHDNIRLLLSTSYNDSKGFNLTLNSMSIDEYFGYDIGALEYRTIEFRTRYSNNLLPVPVVNYTTQKEVTRITRWDLFPGNPQKDHSLFTIESPRKAELNDEKLYPVNTSNELYQEYLKRVDSSMIFIGRTGKFKYIDMDDAIADAIELRDCYFP